MCVWRHPWCLCVWIECERQWRQLLLLSLRPSAEPLKAALIPYLHEKTKPKTTGTESRLKNDNDLHFSIMLSVGCYCDKVLHVSLPNESGCSVMCATKTFGRTCHPLLFLVNEHGKSIYVLLQCTGEIRRGFWLIGRQPEQPRRAPVKIYRKKTEEEGRRRSGSTRGDAGKVARSPNTKPGGWGMGKGVLAGWSAALTTPGPGTN